MRLPLIDRAVGLGKLRASPKPGVNGKTAVTKKRKRRKRKKTWIPTDNPLHPATTGQCRTTRLRLTTIARNIPRHVALPHLPVATHPLISRNLIPAHPGTFLLSRCPARKGMIKIRRDIVSPTNTMEEESPITRTVPPIVVLFPTVKFPLMRLRRFLLVTCGVKSSILDTLPAMSPTFPIPAKPPSFS
jgi:hypothetical protein